MSSSVLSRLREQGWCVVPDVIPADVVLRCYYEAYRLVTTCGVIAPAYPRNMSWQLRAQELMEDVVNPARRDDVLADQFYIRPAVINDSQVFAPALAEPRVAEIVDAALGRDARVTFTTLYVHEPETKRGPWHGGGPFHPAYAAHYPSPYPDAAPHLTAHVLFSDFTAENGGILAVPGSHRRPTNPAYEPREKRFVAEPTEMNLTAKAGSVLIMDSRLWHAIAPNPSDFPRVSVVVEYAPAREKLPASLANAKVPPMSAAVFHRLPASVQPLFRDWTQKR